MKLSRRFKRVASALLAVTMAFVMTFSTDVMPMADSKQDQLKAEVEAKQAELDKVNATIKEAKDNKANVVMCSAMGQEAMVVEAVQAGIKDFIVKPFKEDRLMKTVNSILGNP